MGRRTIPFRTLLVAVAVAILVLAYGEVSPPAHSIAKAPAEDWSVWIVESQSRFGGRHPSNYCPAMFGPEVVRPDLVVRVEVLQSRNEAHLIREELLRQQGLQLFAWAESDPPRVFLTQRALDLPSTWRLALLFHEVRGHIELRYTDDSMKSVLCPTSPNEDTHCITAQIVAGCPTLRGLSSDEVLRRMGITPPAVGWAPGLRQTVKTLFAVR
jgi:hypothetical protein